MLEMEALQMEVSGDDRPGKGEEEKDSLEPVA